MEKSQLLKGILGALLSLGMSQTVLASEDQDSEQSQKETYTVQVVPGARPGLHCEFLLHKPEEAAPSLNYLNMAFESFSKTDVKLDLMPATSKALIEAGFKEKHHDELYTSPDLNARAVRDPRVSGIYFIEIKSGRQLIEKIPISFPPLFVWKFAGMDQPQAQFDYEFTSKSQFKDMTMGFVDHPTSKPYVRRIINMTKMDTNKPEFNLSIDVPCNRLGEYTSLPHAEQYDAYEDILCRVHILTATISYSPPRPNAH